MARQAVITNIYGAIRTWYANSLTHAVNDQMETGIAIAIAIIVRIKNCLEIRNRMFLISAPLTFLIPISLVLRSVVKDINPNIPRVAITMQIIENRLIIFNCDRSRF